MPALERLNGLSPPQALEALMRCCGSSRWAEKLVGLRPFSDENALYSSADKIWRELSRQDWLEAFSHHPKIGANANSAWAKQEQSGVQGAGQEVLAALAKGNRDYEQKFGYIFLICATGKSAGEMLAVLQGRLKNSPEMEIGFAAREQEKITRIRLEKWLKS